MSKEDYELNPKICCNCGKVISYKKKANKYCNHSCATSLTNRRRIVKSRNYTYKGLENIKKSNKERNKNFLLRKEIKKNFYNENPKQCCICKSNIPFERKVKETCSQKCTKINSGIKISNTRRKKFLNGELKVTGGTTKWYNVECSKGIIRVQGSYEVRTINILDKLKKIEKIFDWEYTNDRIGYIGMDEKFHTYLFDFKIWKNKIDFYYLEVKGYSNEKDILKWIAAKEKGLDLIVWFEKDIIEQEMFK